ncbi:ABC transporter substrate-binding protein [Streptomyces beijiangensis]|uniref:Extracellular solute-binding protein n=1 Tax=Streptomyces beijiangensis TaxID=163361 RepID=A0A939F2X1_9ACTN|nr:extracellular solute-binding protein [Streptomyces beijiangensis]MBO0510404.1 extracellular solute-binding protein [Streptomyces beijiangensis]
MNRIARLAVPLTALTLAAVGCSPAGTDAGSSGAGGKKEITFLTFETPNLDAAYWDAAIARAEAKVPGLKVKKLVAPSTDRTGYAKQLLASGQFPDVMISVSPVGFAESGQMAPWTDKELAQYTFPHSNPIGGKVYQLPYNTQPTPLVYYSKKLFAEADITAPPRTYQELLDDSAKLKSKGIDPFVVGGGGKDTFASSYLWTALVGTDVYKQTPDWMAQRRAGKVAFNDAGFKGATDKFVQLVKKGYVDKAGLSRDYANTEKAFLGGKGAMYPMGTWFATAGDKSAMKDDIGVFAFPTDDGSLSVPSYTGGGMSVSAKSKNLKEAKEFALAFQQDKANLDAVVKSDGAIIAMKGYTPPAGMGPVYDATVKVYDAAVQAKGVTNAFLVETGDDALLPGLVEKSYALAQDVIAGRKDADAATKALDEDWKKAATQ